MRSWAVITVADGMGGMAAGEVASAVAVNTVLAEATAVLAASPNLSAEEQARMTTDWVRKANEKVCDAMEAKQAKGGCTLVCAFLLDKRLTIGHVGDCRIYLIRDGSIQTLTRDHSVAMSLVMQSQLDISQLRGYPDRSNVTRSLGDARNCPDITSIPWPRSQERTAWSYGRATRSCFVATAYGSPSSSRPWLTR